MGDLYVFSPLAYWFRKAGNTSGPLIIPTYEKMKASSKKEKVYDERMLRWLATANSPKAYAHIISPTYGPSRGLRSKGKKIRLVMAVYPGPGDANKVMIKSISPNGRWGVIEGFDEDVIPALNITNKTHPWLIHRVYGSNKKGTAVLLKDAMYLPIVLNNRFIEMKWLVKEKP